MRVSIDRSVQTIQQSSKSIQVQLPENRSAFGFVGVMSMQIDSQQVVLIEPNVTVRQEQDISSAKQANLALVQQELT